MWPQSIPFPDIPTARRRDIASKARVKEEVETWGFRVLSRPDLGWVLPRRSTFQQMNSPIRQLWNTGHFASMSDLQTVIHQIPFQMLSPTQRV